MGEPAVSAELSDPTSVAVDVAGNVYVADMGNGRIRKLSQGPVLPNDGVVNAGKRIVGPCGTGANSSRFTVLG